MRKKRQWEGWTCLSMGAQRRRPHLGTTFMDGKESSESPPVKEFWQDAKATIHRSNSTSHPGWPWKYWVGLDKVYRDETMYISCRPIVTQPHFPSSVLISFFCRPSFKNFLVYSAILPLNPLSWVALRW